MRPNRREFITSTALSLSAVNTLANAEPFAPPALPLDMRLQRAPQSLLVVNRYFQLTCDLVSGLCVWQWGETRKIQGADCAVRMADGTELKASAYPRHICGNADVAAIQDGFGAGLRLTIHHRDAGRPELRQTLWVYSNRPYGFAQIEAIGEDELVSNHISPLLVEASAQSGIVCDAGGPLQVLFVPFDNDEFVRYNSHDWGAEAESYEVTAIYDNTTRHGFVFGSVSHDLWKTGIAIRQLAKQRVGGLRVYGGANGYWSHDKQPHGSVRGKILASPRIFIGWFADWRDGMEAFGKANAVITPPLAWTGHVPLGWNSWAAHKEHVTVEHIRATSEFLQQTLEPHGFLNDNTAYVNMDSYWDFIPEDKMLAEVRNIHRKGQKAGIYWTPFTGWGDDLDRKVEGTDGRWTYHDIGLKDEKGNCLPKLDNGWPLDVTHPGTQQCWNWQFARFVQWGFDFVKLDFMTHGALEGAHYDKSVQTGIAAYNLGMKQIVQTFDPIRIGRPFFLSLSIAPLFPSGYAHSRRISCDAFASIGQSEYLLNAATYGWWTRGTLYPFNDPDHTIVYKVYGEGAVSEAEGRTRLNASVVAGAMLLNSDDLTNPDARARVQSLFANAELLTLARRGLAFRPVEGDTGAQAADTFTLNTPQGRYLAVFNFSPKEKATKTISLARLGLAPGTGYEFHDLWTRQTTEPIGNLKLTLEPAASTIYRIDEEKV